MQVQKHSQSQIKHACVNEFNVRLWIHIQKPLRALAGSGFFNFNFFDSQEGHIAFKSRFICGLEMNRAEKLEVPSGNNYSFVNAVLV